MAKCNEIVSDWCLGGPIRQLWPDIFQGSCWFHLNLDWHDLKRDFKIPLIVTRLFILLGQNTTKSCLIGVLVDRSDKLWPDTSEGNCSYDRKLDWHDLKCNLEILPLVTFSFILWWQNATKSCLIGVWWTDQTNYDQKFSRAAVYTIISGIGMIWNAINKFHR